MSLVGPWFVGFVAMLTVAGFGAAVCWWPRWSGSGPAALLGRVGVLFGVSALVLVTAAALLNNVFVFFADWNDLLGAAGPGTTTTAHVGTDAESAVGQSLPLSARDPIGGTGSRSGVHGSGPPALPTDLGPKNRIHTYTITGARTGIRAQVVVELPPAYFDPAQAGRRFPVIETFHGYPGRPNQWVAGMALGTVWQQEEASGHLGAAVIVSPDVEYPAGVDSECVDGGPAGPQVETWASQDVPDWVRATFRVRSDRQSWATIGLSAGGWCAALVTMHHPERYCAAIVLGGYFRPEFTLYTPFTPDSPAGRNDDLVRMAAAAPPPVALWVQTSKADQVSYATSKAMIAAARPPMAVQSTVLANAGHRFSLWQGLLPQALRWLGRTAPGFTISR